MVEKEKVFSSKIKYSGLFTFSDFYRFCYEWLDQQTDLDVAEDQYAEKIKGDVKEIEFKWSGSRKVTDYFKFSVKVDFRIIGMKEVEVTKQGIKTKMNQGNVEVKMSGTLERDYQGITEILKYKFHYSCS
jgi:hypothetical protein